MMFRQGSGTSKSWQHRNKIICRPTALATQCLMMVASLERSDGLGDSDRPTALAEQCLMMAARLQRSDGSGSYLDTWDMGIWVLGVGIKYSQGYVVNFEYVNT